jgi:hypothetical protein
MASSALMVRGRGLDYEDSFKIQFASSTRSYSESLIDATWQTEWPYRAAEIGASELFFDKLKLKLRVPPAFGIDYSLAAPGDFLGRMRDYLATLIAPFAEPGDHTVVMHNSIEPFSPSRALRYFHDARSIIVDRDPRDVYVAQNRYVTPGSNSKPRPYRSVTTTPDIFCRRFRTMRKVAASAPDDPQRLLRVNFEDVVLGYDASLKKIMSFLGETPATHVRAREYFKPEQSTKKTAYGGLILIRLPSR